MSSSNSSVESLLKDAEKLVSRLKTHEKAADLLLGQSDGLHKTIKAKSAYMQEITALNEVARHRPRSELVLGIQMENQQIRRLQAENRDLRMLIDEHQSAVDVIMTKYREQMALIVAAKNTNKTGNARNAAHLDDTLRKKRDKLEEISTVMKRAMDVDENSDEKRDDAVARLTRENQVLRELLKICDNDNNDNDDERLRDPAETVITNEPNNAAETKVETTVATSSTCESLLEIDASVDAVSASRTTTAGGCDETRETGPLTVSDASSLDS